jgi:hypothetical protein
MDVGDVRRSMVVSQILDIYKKEDLLLDFVQDVGVGMGEKHVVRSGDFGLDFGASSESGVVKKNTTGLGFGVVKKNQTAINPDMDSALIPIKHYKWLR